MIEVWGNILDPIPDDRLEAAFISATRRKDYGKLVNAQDIYQAWENRDPDTPPSWASWDRDEQGGWIPLRGDEQGRLPYGADDVAEVTRRHRLAWAEYHAGRKFTNDPVNVGQS